MLDEIVDFQHGRKELDRLISDLRGLFVEADPHDPEVREVFEAKWAPIDGEHELRTESWAPKGAASEVRLSRLIEEFRYWVVTLIAADVGHEHR